MSLSFTRVGISDPVDLSTVLKQQVPSIDHISYEPTSGKCDIYFTGGTPASGSTLTLLTTTFNSYTNPLSSMLFSSVAGTAQPFKLDTIGRLTSSANAISITSDVNLVNHVISDSGPPVLSGDLCRKSYVDGIGPGAGLSQTNQVFSVLLDPTTLQFDSANRVRISSSAAGIGLEGGGSAPLAVRNSLTNVTRLGTLDELTVSGTIVANSGLNVQGNRIVSLGNPVTEFDAVNLQTLTAAVLSLPGSGLALTNGTLSTRLDGTSLSINATGQIAIASAFVGTGLTGGTLGVPLRLTTSQPTVTSLGTQVQLTVSGPAIFQSTVDSADFTSGGVQLKGGLGVAGSINTGGSVATSGSMSVGLGLTIGAAATFLSTADSSSPSTGGVQIKGGMGVMGSVNIASGLYVGNGVNLSGKLLSNVADPVSVSDGANKRYVDSLTATAGSGLVKTGTSFSVNVDGSSIELRGDGKLRLASGAVGPGLSGGSGTVLSINSAQPAITSVGTLTGLVVGGALNVTSTSTLANVSVLNSLSIGGNMSVTGLAALAGGFSVASVTDATSIGVGAGIIAGGLSVAKNLQIGGILNMNGQQIVNLASPTGANDSATKAYVDGVVAALPGWALSKSSGMLNVLVDGTSIEISSSNALRVASSIAGVGLSGGSGSALSVKAYQPQIVSVGALMSLTVAGTTTLSSTLAVTGATTLGLLNAGVSTLGATTIGAITGTSAAFSNTLSAGATTLGATTIGAISGTSATFSGTVSVTGTSTLGTLSAGNATLGTTTIDVITGTSASFSGTLTVTGSTTLGASTIGAITGTSATFSSTLSVSGNTTLNALSAGASTLGASTIGAITGTSATFSSNLTVSNSTILNSLSVSSISLTGTFSQNSSTFLDALTPSAGTLANWSYHSIAVPTLAALNTAVRTTTASTLYIAGAPLAGMNETITNPYSLHIASGATLFGGSFRVTGASTFSTVAGTSATLSGTLGVTGASTLSTISGTSASLSGSLTVTGALTGTTAIFSTVSTVAAIPLTVIQPNLSPGNSTTIGLGVSNSNYNAVGLTFNYVSAGSLANNFRILIQGQTAGVTLLGTGAINIESNLAVAGNVNPSASGGGGALTVIGDIIHPRAFFPSVGTAAPSFTTRSAGSRLIILPQISTTLADLAIGVDTSTLWYGIGANSATWTHRWYGGTTNIMTLDGLGNLSVVGIVSVVGSRSGTPVSNGGHFLSINNATFTDSATAASTTVANFNANYIGQPTLAASNTAVTTTRASTLTIAGPPIAGANETVTTAYSLNVAAGNSSFNGMVTVLGDTNLLGSQIVLPYAMRIYTSPGSIGGTPGTSLRFRMYDPVNADCRLSLGNLVATGSYNSKIALYTLNTAESSANYERLEVIAGGNGASVVWTAAGTGALRNLTIYGTMTYTPTGLVSISNTTDATSTTVASLTLAGGVGVRKSVKLGGSYSAAGQPAFSACHLSATSVTSGVETNLVFDTILADQTNSWATPTYTAPENGLYVVNLTYGFNNLQLAVDMIVRIRVTNTATSATRVHIVCRCNPSGCSGNGEIAGSGSIMVPLVANDTITTTVLGSGGIGNFTQMGSALVTRNSLSIYKIA